MLLSKKKLYKIKKSKNQSQKKYNKKRKKKKKGRKRRSFSKRKKHLNLKNKSLKFRIKKQKGGNNRIDFQLIFLTSKNREGNHIMKLINFQLEVPNIQIFLNTRISSAAFINIIDALTLRDPEDNLEDVISIKLLGEETVQSKHFEHVGLVVNTYNYNAIKHILIKNTPSDIKGEAIFDALKKYFMDGEEGGMGRRTSLKLANAVFSDGGDAAVADGYSASATGDAGSDDSKSEYPDGVAPPRPSGISVVDIAQDGSVRKSDDSPDNDPYRGDKMDVYTDYDKETPWTKVPLSLGARDPIHKKSGMGTTNYRDGPSYPHNLVFEITTKNDADGTKTNMNILDAGDGPLTVDAFNELLLKKYRYKKPLTKEELEEQDEDDRVKEEFGSEEEDEAVESDDEDTGNEPEAQTIEEGSVEIQASPSGNSPDPGLTIEISANTDEEMETRIVIESGPHGSDGVLLGGGKIMSGGNPKKYRLHLDKPLLYKHENPKTAITKTTSRSLQEMHKKFERQLKKKYEDGETYTNIKNKIQELTMDDIQNNLSNPEFISRIKKTAVDSAEIAKAAATTTPASKEAGPASKEAGPEKQSTEINLLLKENKYNNPYTPTPEEKKVMEFIQLLGGWRHMEMTIHEIQSHKDIKEDRKEQLESKLKEIMKKACPEKFDKDLYTGDFNEPVIIFLLSSKTGNWKDIEELDATNIKCIALQLEELNKTKIKIEEMAALSNVGPSNKGNAQKAAAKAIKSRLEKMGKKKNEEYIDLNNFWEMAYELKEEEEEEEEVSAPVRKHINRKLFYAKKLDFINEIIHKWREWNAEAIKINNEINDIKQYIGTSATEHNPDQSPAVPIIEEVLNMDLNSPDIDARDKELIKIIKTKQPALYKFIPTEDDTLITLINKFIYFNFIYNKLIESGKYDSWKAEGNKPSAIEYMQVIFFDNMNYNNDDYKDDWEKHMNKVIIPLFKLYDEFFKLCRNTILSFEIFEEICKFSDTTKFNNLYIYTHCVGKFTELKNLWINYVRNISNKIIEHIYCTERECYHATILHIFKYTINEFMTTFTEEKIKEYSLVKNILENVINKSIDSEDIKNSNSKKPDKIMLKTMIENLQNVKKNFEGGKEPSGDIWRDCYVKTFAQGPTRITLILEDMCNAYKVKYLPKDEPRNINKPLSKTDERWVMDGKTRTTLKTEKKYVDRVKKGDAKPCPGENEASSVLFDLDNGNDNVIKMNIYTMRLEGEPKKYVKYYCYRYFNFVPKKYNGTEKEDANTLKNYEEMRKRLTIDYQYTLMQRDIRDGIVETNNAHTSGWLKGAATKLFLETRDPYSPFYMIKVNEGGEEKSKMVDYNIEGSGWYNHHFAPVTPDVSVDEGGE